ncbi:hypothetical protein CRECT_1485 [Campylobacter rectus]|uniref:Uncharacterized protein n=1 Tax=Campylobacter rectus TaxID=203 RepID=A0A6G5QN12_CAMRE|nr:hypothetical protein CRECT_1485 [Campylobacter rectus]
MPFADKFKKQKSAKTNSSNSATKFDKFKAVFKLVNSAAILVLQIYKDLKDRIIWR